MSSHSHSHSHSHSSHSHSSKDDYHLLIANKCSSAIINKLENELDPEKTEVLDFACGIGLVSQGLCSYVKSIVGIDISQDVVDEYNKRVWQQGIGENEMKAICLELKESEGDQLNGRKFDLVICTSAYHHINDIVATTRALASYLKPSGKLIVIDLLKSPEISELHREQNDVIHKGGFHSKDVEKAFLDAKVLEDVETEIAFNFNRVDEKSQKEYSFEYLIVTGKKK